jgi:outer membrane lipoprotein-sorting protein
MNTYGAAPLLALVLSLLVPGQSTGQNNVSMGIPEIRQHLLERFQRIQDYQVDLEVSLDMPKLRMPRKRMTFSFKQPDKTRLDAKGFAMVPRRGLALSPDSMLAEMNSLSVVGDTLINQHPGLILEGSMSDLENMTLAAKILVDSELWVVRSITTYLDTFQVLHLSIEYSEVAPEIHLPVETRLQFQMNEQFLRSRGSPRHFDPDGPGLPQLDMQTAGDIHGEATIKFSRYRVNQGLPDSFFIESLKN